MRLNSLLVLVLVLDGAPNDLMCSDGGIELGCECSFHRMMVQRFPNSL